MPTPLLTSLISSGECVLYLDFRAGHMLDLSGNGNNGIGTDITWTNKGIGFPITSSRVTVANSAELQSQQGALVVITTGAFYLPGSQYLVSKQDAGGCNYLFYTYETPRIFMQDNVSGSAWIGEYRGLKGIAANFADTETSDLYGDGVYLGTTGSANNNIDGDDAPITIGNVYTGGASNFKNTIQAVVITNRKLTATEHAQLYGELANMTWPTKVKGRGQGKYGVELVTDGDMEAAGVAAWSVGGSCALTKETGNVLAGSQVLRLTQTAAAWSGARQSILTTGTRYRISGWGRGNGVQAPQMGTGPTIFWTGTVAATWQRFDMVILADGPDFYLYSSAAAAPNYVEFDNVSVQEVLVDDTQFKTDWQAHAGDTNFAAGAQLENTPFYVASGTFEVTTDTIEGETCKVLECTSSGTAYMATDELQETPFQSAYGTWEFWLSKDPGSTTLISIISNLAGTAGYYLGFSLTEVISFVEIGAAALMTSAAGYINPDTWYKYRITRRQSDGQFTVYVNDVLLVAAAGTNPAADNTVTTAERIGFAINTGDKIALGDRVGNHNFRKLHGVIAP